LVAGARAKGAGELSAHIGVWSASQGEPVAVILAAPPGRLEIDRALGVEFDEILTVVFMMSMIELMFMVGV
jgi:hypothetical protein